MRTLHDGREATIPEATDVGSAAQVSPTVRMMQLLYSSLVTQLVAVAAELGLADLVAAEPRPIDELAAATGTLPDPLYRAMRALASQGVFTEVSRRTFGLTPLAATLCTGATGSLRDSARYFGVRARQHAFTELAYSLRTGRSAFDHLHGTDWYSYLAAHPAERGVFADAMGNVARQVHAAAIEAYDLSDVRRLVDVGGGHGHLVATLLRRYSGMRAVVFDRPEVVAGADRVLIEAGVRDRADLLGGDFFAGVPAGADAYVLSWVLMDWDDPESIALLSAIRKAAEPSGKVLVLNSVLPEGDAPHPGKLTDIVMLALLHGRERTEAEFVALFEAAGLCHVETRPTSSPTSVLVAAPPRPERLASIA